MKLIPLFLYLLTFSFLSTAQQIQENEVPANVKAVALTQTNNQPVTMWVLDKKRNKYVASIISNTSAKGIEVTLDGKWIKTTEAIFPNTVPASVIKATREQFPEYDLKNFFYVTAPDKSPHYTIDASSDDEDLTLFVDANGKIFKKEAR